MSTTSSTSPNDPLSIEDLFERALAAGVARGEIEALILQAGEARRPGRCTECAAGLVALANGTSRCPSCGIGMATANEVTR